MNDTDPKCEVVYWNRPEFILSCSADNDENQVHGLNSRLVQRAQQLPIAQTPYRKFSYLFRSITVAADIIVVEKQFSFFRKLKMPFIWIKTQYIDVYSSTYKTELNSLDPCSVPQYTT